MKTFVTFVLLDFKSNYSFELAEIELIKAKSKFERIILLVL